MLLLLLIQNLSVSVTVMNHHHHYHHHHHHHHHHHQHHHYQQHQQYKSKNGYNTEVPQYYPSNVYVQPQQYQPSYHYGIYQGGGGAGAGYDESPRLDPFSPTMSEFAPTSTF